jgi:hypothetical protein
MTDLIPINEAAELADRSAAHLRRLAGAGRIEGAELRQHEGARGRWYVPRKWAENYRRPQTMGERIRERRRAHPDETQAETARALGCDPGHVSRVVKEAPPTPAAEPSKARPETPLAGLALYRRATMPGELVAMAQNGQAWRMPDRGGGWAARVELSTPPAAHGLERLDGGAEAAARLRLVAGL